MLFIFIDNFLIPWYVNSPETVVPDVTGLMDEDAIALLDNAGFDPVVVDTTYGETYEAGIIFLQKPAKGKVVKEGRKIYLFVSGGAHVVYVPRLIGKSVVDARFALERLGLELGIVTQLPSDKPENMIFDQQFAEGTPLEKGQTVNITISAGRSTGTIFVPDLIGKSLAQAERILTDSLLVLGKLNYQVSSTLLPNTVLDQYPSSGNRVNRGESIDLFVTKSSESELLDDE
ncbi:PASTA domain-containing protein [Bacteroidota bacterium]